VFYSQLRTAAEEVLVGIVHTLINAFCVEARCTSQDGGRKDGGHAMETEWFLGFNTAQWRAMGGYLLRFFVLKSTSFNPC